MEPTKLESLNNAASFMGFPLTLTPAREMAPNGMDKTEFFYHRHSYGTEDLFYT